MSIRNLLTSAAAISLIMLTGCADMQLNTLKSMPKTGSEFSQALANEYQQYSERESREFNDPVSTAVFSKKGQMAANGNGEMVEPEHVCAWIISNESARHELMQQREHLVKWLPCGQKKAPMEAAAAQRSFDEWVEQTMEGWQASDIANARQRFMDNLKAVEMKCTEHTVTTTVKHKKKHIPGLQPMVTTSVNFALNKSMLTAEAMKKLEALDKNTDPAAYVVIKGYTDGCGTKKRNATLSNERAHAVEKFLLDNKNLDRVEAEGEGVAPGSAKIQPENRRVDVSVYNPNHKTKSTTETMTKTTVTVK